MLNLLYRITKKKKGGMMSPVKYTKSSGEPGEISTPLIDQLVEIVSGKNASANRTLAAEILKFVAQKRAENEALPDFGVHAGGHHMMLNVNVMALWEHRDTFRLKTVKGQDGAERLEMERVIVMDEPLPLPIPVPAFDPAVPLPVIAPSAEEQKAIREFSFDERFSPGAVAARVAAIEKEAAVIRRMREQTE
jgi:hypothetical protein